MRVYKNNLNRVYKEQKVNSGFIPCNVVMIVCCNCGEMYEEEVLGVNSDYESVSVCFHCQFYNSI